MMMLLASGSIYDSHTRVILERLEISRLKSSKMWKYDELSLRRGIVVFNLLELLRLLVK